MITIGSGDIITIAGKGAFLVADITRGSEDIIALDLDNQRPDGRFPVVEIGLVRSGLFPDRLPPVIGSWERRVAEAAIRLEFGEEESCTKD